MQLVWYSHQPPAHISVSSDGRYVISTHYGRFLILWDIEKHTQTTLSTKAGIHSAYFIPDTHYFLWQHVDTHEVYVQSIDGTVDHTLNPGFPVYGHVMTSDLSHYVASTENWKLVHHHNDTWKTIKYGDDTEGGSALLLQFSLQNNRLLTAGHGNNYDISISRLPTGLGHTRNELYHEEGHYRESSLLNEVVLWDITTQTPILKCLGANSKIKQSLSPDGIHIVAGDENGATYLWNASSGKRTPLQWPWYEDDEARCSSDFSETIKLESNRSPAPLSVIKKRIARNSKNVAIRFISDQGDFIRFTEEARYGMLYNISSPCIQKFLYLGLNPHPTTFSVFQSSETIDTAPKAGILVMGQSRYGKPDGNSTGIIVYKFDTQTKTLKLPFRT